MLYYSLIRVYQFCVNLKELGTTEALRETPCKFEDQYNTIAVATLLETLTTKDFCSGRDKFNTALELDILNPTCNFNTNQN